jgi:hypothetical protein
MFRQSFAALAVAACLTTSAVAAERATVVLKDGSRQSGELVFHGSNQRNIIDDFVNLGNAGQEKGVPLDQVALIDFGAGDVTAADLQQLDERSHLLVLRGNVRQRGKLLNIVRGDTLQWQNESGQSQEYAVRDVARVILNAEAARRLHPQQAAAVPASNDDDGPVPSGAVRVDARRWVSSGMRVRKGDMVAFRTTGRVQVSPDQAHTSGPDGNPNVPGANLLVPEMPVGGLIGRVDDSEPFPIGSNRAPIAMPENGLLMLGVNDSEHGDNSGAFTVEIDTDAARGRRR